jgi:N-acetylglucosaminyldiphosphoundecaprenol N-acetyl-beta-D-mannosaminyltransferase
VLGVSLAAVTVDQAVARGLQGGLVLAPSGPGLCDLPRDPDYREALLGADLNPTDSGFVLLVRLLRGHRLAASTSGLRYLHQLLRHPSVHAAHETYWVMPSHESMLRNLAWLKNHGHEVTDDDCYVASAYPRRGRVEAPSCSRSSSAGSRTISSCASAAVFRRSSACISTGISPTAQAPLCRRDDRVPQRRSGENSPLGRQTRAGLARQMSDHPKVFVLRYLRAFKLAYLIRRYDEKAPPSATARE